AGIQANIAQATGFKKLVVQFATSTGREVAQQVQAGQPISGLLALKYKLANKLVYSKLKPAVGLGNARVCVSGAAPIAKGILEFFASLDIYVLEVYGQSEDSGPTTFNQPSRVLLGSVGPRVPGVEVELAEDGEILVKGPNVFLGYYRDEEATQAALTDGWLHSGDLGSFDKNGFLHITGRKKDIIITAGGKNIAPKNLENDLKSHPLVHEAVVVGDRRKFLSVLVTLDPEAASAWAERHARSTDALHEDGDVLAEVQKAIDKLNTKVARVEQLKKFTILPRPLTIEHGELTPTLKVKRNKVAEHFSNEIESMYAE
ncbi:MAG: AMP-binding protein, partial [Myxococcota bacterium]